MLKYIGDFDKLKDYGFDDYYFRTVGCGNGAIHIQYDRKITYGTYMSLDIYKMNIKHVQDLFKDGFIIETETAILPLKEMPSSCQECKYKSTSHHWQSIWYYDCKLTNLKEMCSYSQGNYEDKFYTQRHKLCPLISIDIDELEESIAYSTKSFITNKYNLTAHDVKMLKYKATIKSTIDKLKGKIK